MHAQVWAAVTQQVGCSRLRLGSCCDDAGLTLQSLAIFRGPETDDELLLQPLTRSLIGCFRSNQPENVCGSPLRRNWGKCNNSSNPPTTSPQFGTLSSQSGECAAAEPSLSAAAPCRWTATPCGMRCTPRQPSAWPWAPSSSWHSGWRRGS